MAFDIKDYVDVAARLIEFHKKYPDGRITRQGEPQLVELPRGASPEKQKTFVIYTALAYRTPDDPVPAIGTAWEPWPGPTMFTKDSEVMNAETGAWGRAIIAAGIPSKKIASKEEVLARAPEKPTLEQTVSSEELIEKLKEEFQATEETDELDGAFTKLDTGQQAWVLKTVSKQPVKRNEQAVSEARQKLTAAQVDHAAAIAQKLAAKTRT